MRAGILVPQGWVGEYDGWEPARAWARTVAVAKQADELGFDSIWLFDHFHTIPEPSDEITFEAFVALSALAVETRRARLGHLVLCAGYRNPALTMKMISTLDVVSGGRAELGLGAGWKEDEWRAYGYGYPPLRERLGALEDTLEIATRMLGPGHATYSGPYASVHGAINVPKGVQQPRVPIIVGGNGQNVTWRLAARFADELNVDWLQPDEVASSLPVIAARCEEVGRDPGSLRVSVNIGRDHTAEAGPRRVALLRAYADAGADRVMTLLAAAATSDDALRRFADDCAEAGVTFG